MSKKYYWLKLKNTYFNQLTQKKMKRQPNGKEMQIIYLRMLLSSIDKEGKIYYQGVYDSLEEELAEEFDESIEIVKQTIRFLIDNNMVTIDDSFNCYIPEAAECIGSECESAERVRNFRNRKALQCNKVVTDSDDDVTISNNDETLCNTEIEKREEKELERESEEIGEAPPDTSGINLPLNDNTFFDISPVKLIAWKKAYPAVDVEHELQRMIAWLDANPEKGRDKNSILSFINRWLAKEQDKGGRSYHRKEEKPASTLPYANEPEPEYHWPELGYELGTPEGEAAWRKEMEENGWLDGTITIPED